MKSPLIFRIYKKEQIHVVKQFLDEGRIVVGNGSEVQISLDSPDVSIIHALIEKRGNQYFLCDLGSGQGTFKGDKAILDEPIESGDSFQIGPFNIFFFIGTQKIINAGKTENKKEAAVVKPVIANVSPKEDVVVNTKAGSATVVADKAVAQPSAASKPEVKTNSVANYLVEVVVSWRGRVLNTYHFNSKINKKLALGTDIQIPEGTMSGNWQLVRLAAQIEISSTEDMKVELLKDGDLHPISDKRLTLSESEACVIGFANGIELKIRYARKAPTILFDSPLIFSSSEFAGILTSLIIAVLASLIVSVNRPKVVKNEDDIERVAQIIFIKPPVQNEVPLQPVDKETKPVAQKPNEPEKLKQVILSDKTQEGKTVGDPTRPVQKAQAAQTAGRAAEIKPKDTKLKAKMFTSTKHGGAVKTSETNAANAQSKQPDPTNSGLLAAFNEGGARQKLDTAYNGAGELIGAGEKATGSSGFDSNRAGEDLGSRIKDTGAGGAGSATQGISGIGVRGRSTGMGTYGSGTGFGDKDRVQIRLGGSEESFVGSIDRDAVYRVLKAAYPQFKRCYEREYRVNTKLEGKVVVTWEIHEQGVAKNVRVLKDRTTINNTSVEECVKAKMQELKFPEPPANTSAEVTIPFVFQGQKF